MSVYILALETSCDETACSVIKDGKEVLSNIVSSQINIHSQFGGVIPEVASRIHVENISLVIQEALEKAEVTMDEVAGIAVTVGPGLIGSLHVGVMAAKTIAWLYDKPLIPIHHIVGHIYANKIVDEIQFPLLSLVVSGGHSELVFMKDDWSFKVLGTTQDDAVGEAYDKVARLLHLPYPGGPQIDRLAKQGKPHYTLKTPKTEGAYDFSFSGLKSSVLQLMERLKKQKEEIVEEDIAYSFQEVALNMLVDKTMLAVEQYKPKHVVLAGGVAANSRLRSLITEKMEAYPDVKLTIPPLSCCTDNAAMIGVSGYMAYQKGLFADLSIGANPWIDIESS